MWGFANFLLYHSQKPPRALMDRNEVAINSRIDVSPTVNSKVALYSFDPF
jgi:hypothetical protein